MSEERLELIKENVYMRSEIATISGLGIDTSLREELELIEEIDRLNNIINELEKYLKENIKLTKTAVHFERLDDYDTRKYKRDIALFEMVLDKLKELKDSD